MDNFLYPPICITKGEKNHGELFSIYITKGSKNHGEVYLRIDYESAYIVTGNGGEFNDSPIDILYTYTNNTPQNLCIKM